VSIIDVVLLAVGCIAVLGFIVLFAIVAAWVIRA